MVVGVGYAAVVFAAATTHGNGAVRWVGSERLVVCGILFHEWWDCRMVDACGDGMQII